MSSSCPNAATARATSSAGCAARPPVRLNPNNSPLALRAAVSASIEIVNSSMMTSSRKQHNTELHSALRAARENENRWLGMNAEYATDSNAMEQWANTARLRRLEVERIEALLAQAEEV
jgi:hypothetical protein